MQTTIGRVTVLVEDYDEALEFYTETLGFDVLADRKLDTDFGRSTWVRQVSPRSACG